MMQTELNWTARQLQVIKYHLWAAAMGQSIQKELCSPDICRSQLLPNLHQA